jgi:hypothetical protein
MKTGMDSKNSISYLLDEIGPRGSCVKAMDAFVTKLMMTGIGFKRAKAAAIGRRGYSYLNDSFV